MSIFRKKERDLGVCAAVMCPHCQSLSQFMLREVSAALAFYSVRLFEVDRCYQLVCGSCKFRKDMERKELSAAVEAMRLFTELESGVVTPIAVGVHFVALLVGRRKFARAGKRTVFEV